MQAELSLTSDNEHKTPSSLFKFHPKDNRQEKKVDYKQLKA